MRVRRPTWRQTLAAAAAVALLAPGWSARLVPADHEALLAAAGAARSQVGVTREGAAAGEQWHLQYLDSWWARMFVELGLRRRLPWVVPPSSAAHLPPGAERADGYFAVATAWHWPWWRPGGGVDWDAAR